SSAYVLRTRDNFNCSYRDTVQVNNIEDLEAPALSCTILQQQEGLRIDWLPQSGVEQYEISIDSNAFEPPNFNLFSHEVTGMAINQEITIDLRAALENLPNNLNCDIPTTSTTCIYSACALRLNITDGPTAASCSDSADGQLEIEVRQGTMPFNLRLDDSPILFDESSTTFTLNGLNPGNHQIIMGDGNNCWDTLSFIIPTDTTTITLLELPLFVCEQNGAPYDTLILQSYLGCDSLIVRELFSYPPIPPTISIEVVCDEQVARIDTAILQSVQGCDSLVIAQFIYEPPIQETLSLTSCIASEAETVEEIIRNQSGCDSLIRIVNTTWVGSDVSTIQLATCIESEVGVDTLYYTNQFGCDSLVIQAREYEELMSIDTSLYVCGLDEQMEDSIIRINEEGCEQTVNRTMIPAQEYRIENTGIVCSEEEQDIRTESFYTQAGCDSIVIWNIQYIPPIQQAENVSTCIGESRVETVSYQNEAGCDSLIITRDITYAPIVEQNIEVQICEGESYDFNGTLLSEANIYTETFTSTEGCDSTVTLILETVGSNPVELENDTVTYVANTSNTLTLDISLDEAWAIYILENPQYGQINFNADSLLEYSLSSAFQDYIGLDFFRYRICATDCVNNCDTASIYIDISRECLQEMKLPTGWGITPEDPNGLNISFDPLAEISTDCAEHPNRGNAELLILNKWGEIVYRTKQIGGQSYEAWKGCDSKGNRLPDGVYYFALHFTLNGEKIEPIKGWVTLLSSN
ncbi:MAG: gliding motility-associated C-terminal domain-containing protein, partial [Bacteroidota bacterium]